MSSQCNIRFDNNQHGVYYSGQLLSGTVELITAKQKTIRAIHITINGFAQVRWTESRSRKNAEGKSENYIETFRADEQYLSSRTLVLGQDSGNFFDLHAGKYVYPFQIQLAPQAPSSYNGVYGQIRYEVILTIDRPWKYDNVFRKPFTVISPLDLNANPIYRTPIEKKEEKHFCCGTCFYFKNDPIILKLDIPFTGFAPGQQIDFKIYAENESHVDCREVKIKVNKSVQFTTRTPETKNRFDTVKIAEKRLGPVLKLSRKEFIDFLKIPAIPPSSLETCSIIKIKYTIDVNVKIAGLHKNMNISVPITIGTIPIYGTVLGSGNAITMQPKTPQMNDRRNDETPPAYTTIAPPSYEDAIHAGKLFIDKDEEEKYGSVVPFVPKYPVYHNYNIGSVGPLPSSTGRTVPTPNLTPAITNNPNINSPVAAPISGPNLVPPYPVNPPITQISSPEISNDSKPNPIGWNA